MEQEIIANLIDRHPEAVDIRSFVCGTVLHLLWRHVQESSNRNFLQGCGWWGSDGCADSREAEITQTWNPIFINEDVLLIFLDLSRGL